MFNLYPYTDFHEINLDWIIRKIKELGQAFNDFEAVNKITNAGAWDITKQYQAWTIVSDNNVGYISLKPVPAGIAISNIDYWSMIADYDIIISDLSARIIELETAVDTINNKITALDNRLNLRNFIIITDSYGTILNGDNKTFYEKAFSDLGVSASNYTAKVQSGCGFVREYDGKKFLTLLQEIPTANGDQITDIIVWGGANDITENTADIEAAIGDFMTYAKANFPKAKVGVAHAGVSWNSNGGRSVRFTHSLPAYRNCNEYGAGYIKNSEYILERSNLMADGDTAHPNSNGVDEMAAQLVNYIVTGACDVHYLSTSAASYVMTGGNGTFTWEGYGVAFDNGVVRPLMTAGSFIRIAGSGLNFPKQGATGDVFEFPVSFMCPDTQAVIEIIRCTLFYKDSSDVTRQCPGYLYPSDYDTTTHHVKYGITVASPTDIRNISSVSQVVIQLLDDAYTI